jgi:hypothetical protein
MFRMLELAVALALAPPCSFEAADAAAILIAKDAMLDEYNKIKKTIIYS